MDRDWGNTDGENNHPKEDDPWQAGRCECPGGLDEISKAQGNGRADDQNDSSEHSPYPPFVFGTLFSVPFCFIGQAYYIIISILCQSGLRRQTPYFRKRHLT